MNIKYILFKIEWYILRQNILFTPSEIYDRVFKIAKEEIWEQYPQFKYYDPDTSYEEDYMALFDQFSEFVERITKKEIKND